MYGRPEIRIIIVLTFGIAAALTPAHGGWPWGLDAWLWTGFRDLLRSCPTMIPLLVVAAMVIGDCAARYAPRGEIMVRRPGRWIAAIFVVSAVLLWRLRARRWFGDLAGVDRQQLPTWMLETAEPLGMLTTYYTQHWGAALGASSSSAIAFVTVMVGASAIVAMFLWARTVTSRWVWPFAMLLSSGFTVIFYGYVEKGTPKALAFVAWYLYAGTRAVRERRSGLVAASSLLLSLAALMHGSVLCLLPAHAWFIWRRSDRRAAILGVAAFAAPILGILCLVWLGFPMAGGPWGNVAAPLKWFKAYCTQNCGYDFWSTKHGVDIVHCLLLLSPVGVLCWPEALAHSRDAESRWLALGSLVALFLSAVWFPGFGYLGDWDIFALAPTMISYHAIRIGAARMQPDAFRRLAAAWIVGCGVHTFSLWRYLQLPL